MVVITQSQRIALYSPPSHLETAFLNDIICLRLAIKAARHHLLLFPIANRATDAPYSATEPSLQDKEFAE